MGRVAAAMLPSSQRPRNEDVGTTRSNELWVNAYIPHMIRHRLLLQLNALLFDADRGQQRVALGLVAACLLIGPSLSALHLWSTLWVAVPLLLPRRLTNVAADGRSQVVGLCFSKAESPAADAGR
jgi:hypothetical protein